MSKFKIGDRVQLTEYAKEIHEYINNNTSKIIITDIRQSSDDMTFSYECELHMKGYIVREYILQEHEIAEYKEEIAEENPCRDTVGEPWLAVDLDGTLAKYDGWKGHDQIGEPILPMIEKVKEKLAAGMTVVIFTARVCSAQRQEDTDTALRAITNWCSKHIGVQLPITAEKDFNMIEMWDDRAVQVISNEGITLQEKIIRIAKNGNG